MSEQSEDLVDEHADNSADDKAADSSPSAVLKKLNELKALEKTRPSKESKDLFREYEKEERAVHSFTSLEKSREYVAKLLNGLPEFNRTVMGEKAINQELQLQESIRIRDYSDAEINTTTRRFLTVALGISTIVLFAVVVVSFIGAGIWHWSFDTDKFKAICTVMGASFFAWVGTLLPYYYRPRR